MRGTLLVSISSIFDATRSDAISLINHLDSLEVPSSLLVAPHIDGNWHLAKDAETSAWLGEQRAAGRAIILNGFDQPVKGRRAEFATLEAHEARLRLTGATRQMHKLGFDTDLFAPPRWQLSAGTLEVLPEFNFVLASSTRGVYNLRTGAFTQTRNLSFGEGYGAAKWWRRNIIKAVERNAARGRVVRLSVSARNLEDKKTVADFKKAVDRALEVGAEPKDYRAFL
ncbi:DUF2334 domain-containing protein [Corynebacterium epidermidicanis]|uniref:Putative deacetylase n=1 Tax=Corynebacterium epidermidicanis TaxID=1050174 RepID=A0A0G3GTP7_9CORY|nr:DUF2334 domain-containing protein [Corynebacterium epidermidicanis]AKK03925.1 putative deacetylase [Corynebacterium epidermidicanis]